MVDIDRARDLAGAACADPQYDPDMWFAEDRTREDVPEEYRWTRKQAAAARRLAQTICLEDCPVRDACATWALRHELHGTWGGQSASARIRERSRMGIAVDQPGFVEWMEAPTEEAAYRRELRKRAQFDAA